MLIAHRGFKRDNLENRKIDIIKTVKHTDAIEIDIQLTEDDKLIIFHDSTFKRIGNVRKKISSMTYYEIKEIKFFRDNLDFLPYLFTDFIKDFGGVFKFILVDIKMKKFDEQKLKIITDLINEATKMFEVVVASSANSKVNVKLHKDKTLNLFRISYLMKSRILSNKKIMFDFNYINPTIKIAKNKKWIQKFIDLDIPLNVWTFEKKDDYILISDIYHNKLDVNYISNKFNLFD